MKEHYYDNYDTFKRWVSYFHQIDETKKTNPDSVLVIGVGNGLVPGYLKDRGYNVTTLDVDPELNPDILADVTELSDHLGIYDTIVCCQVLEHLPFASFDVSMGELYKCCNNLVLSLPDNSFNISFNPVIRLPRKIKGYQRLEKKINFTIPTPSFLKERQMVPDIGKHHWEINKMGYPLFYIRDIIKKYFDIEKEYFVSQQPYHRFFVLKK